MIDPPIAMLAELTHRCPLSCPYCSNPLHLTTVRQELTTEAWIDIFVQAAQLGVLQLHLSGGEPASRRDLVELTEAAQSAGLYTNLITSGIGLTKERLRALDAAGLDHIQLSVQSVKASLADKIGNYSGGFDRKMKVVDWIQELGFPLTLNAVMHRHNLDDLSLTIEFAQTIGARRIEIACVQFQGWALRNRKALQPTLDQVNAAKDIVKDAASRLRGKLAIDFVPPDYFSDFPKACMGGWGSTGININPDGTVLPCHAAQTIPHLTFENVKEKSLAEIWSKGQAFNMYRGVDWLPPLCQACERRNIDFGGCRCQAMAILGDAAVPDPVCRKSEGRKVLDAVLAEEEIEDAPVEFVYRHL